MAGVANTDARRSGRVPANLQMEVLLNTQSAKLRQKVSTVDMSLLGVGIRVCGSLVPGQTVTLIPSESSPNVFPCRVVWVKPLGSELYSQVGLEFCEIARLVRRN